MHGRALIILLLIWNILSEQPVVSSMEANGAKFVTRESLGNQNTGLDYIDSVLMGAHFHPKYRYRRNLLDSNTGPSESAKAVRDAMLDSVAHAAVIGRVRNAVPASRHKTLVQTLAHQNSDQGCYCNKFTCACCIDLDIPRLRINDTGCVTLSYVKKEVGLNFVLEINGYILINETVSASNPPPLCYNVPAVAAGSLCAQFHDMEFDYSEIAGCMRIYAKIAGVEIYRKEMGCFRFHNIRSTGYNGGRNQGQGFSGLPSGLAALLSIQAAADRKQPEGTESPFITGIRRQIGQI